MLDSRRKQAEKELNRHDNGFFKCRTVKALSRGNTSVTISNLFLDVAGNWLAKNIPHRKISFVNSLGKQTSKKLTSRQATPFLYRYLKDVFDIEHVQYLPAGLAGNKKVRIALLFLIDNVSKCFWPTAFFDDSVCENQEQRIDEWIHNCEINPYFNEVIVQAKALVNREEQMEQVYQELNTRDRKYVNAEEMFAAEIA